MWPPCSACSTTDAGTDSADDSGRSECVDHVLVFGEDTPREVLGRLRPDVHCKGADYAPPSARPIPEADVVRAYGGRLAFLTFSPGVSTSDIVRRVEQSLRHTKEVS